MDGHRTDRQKKRLIGTQATALPKNQDSFYFSIQNQIWLYLGLETKIEKIEGTHFLEPLKFVKINCLYLFHFWLFGRDIATFLVLSSRIEKSIPTIDFLNLTTCTNLEF